MFANGSQKLEVALLDSGSGSGITALTGDVTATGPGAAAATIQPGVVTLAKLADLATGKVIGRSTAGTGVPEALDAGSVGLAVLATTTQAAARAAIGAGTGSGTVIDVSVTTANGVSGSVATSTTTPAITLTLGAITPISAAFSGTGGNGFVSLLTQSSNPAAPASGFALFADSTGRFSWRRASDGFTRTFELTATADRVFTIPDASFTLAGQNLANTFTLANTFSANGALSAPSVRFTGTPITGGTTTTCKPLFLIETAGAASTAWTTSGTMLGINAPSGGFSGNLLDIQNNGSSRFLVNSAGQVFTASNLYIGNIAGADCVITRKAAANLQLGAADAAAPVQQTLSVQSVAAGTSDTAGASWINNGSRGTGTGAGGSITWQVAPAGSSGSGQNPLVVGLQVYPRSTSTAVRFSGYANSYEYYNFADTSPLTPVNSATAIGQAAYSRQGTETTSDYGFAFVGNNRQNTAGTHTDVVVQRGFAPTSGTALYVGLAVQPTINQTGGANGITRGLYINPTLTAAADFRALEISDGNVVLPKTVTAGGTTGAQTINKVTGSVNFAAAATSLVVTNSYVTTSSIIIATVATNDTTMKSVAVVAAAGSFTIYANAAATAETRVNFIVTN